MQPSAFFRWLGQTEAHLEPLQCRATCACSPPVLGPGPWHWRRLACWRARLREAFPQSSLSPIAQGSALSVEQARSAALRILKAVKDGDANARYAQFSAERQAITSPSMIAATMRTQPKVLGYTLLLSLIHI